MNEEILEFEIGGHTLSLAVTPGVFHPNLTSRLLAQESCPALGGSALVMGCGVAPIAISVAKNGASPVYGVDIVEEAVRLARQNAETNGVGEIVKVLHGSLFAPVEGMRFDVIIDDVSGMADRPARLSPWYPPSVPTGGEDGAELTVQVLEQAREHLNPGGHLFFPVLSLANATRVMATAHTVYGDALRCTLEKNIPFCPELYENMDELEKLQAEGIIDFQRRRKRCLWKLQIFEARIAS